jgi:hypothetical protein
MTYWSLIYSKIHQKVFFNYCNSHLQTILHGVEGGTVPVFCSDFRYKPKNLN